MTTELIKVSSLNIYLLEHIMDMIYEEWGKTFSSSKEDKLLKLKTPIVNGEMFPEAYVLKEGNEIIGSFLLLEHELKDCDLSPFLACVVINKKYRGQGYGNVLLSHIKSIIENGFDKVYLTTEHVGFYEKIGFELIEIIGNNGKNNRLYCKVVK